MRIDSLCCILFVIRVFNKFFYRFLYNMQHNTHNKFLMNE